MAKTAKSARPTRAQQRAARAEARARLQPGRTTRTTATTEAAEEGDRLTATDRANAANTVEPPAGSPQVAGAFEEKPLARADRLKSPEQERLENNPQGTRVDGTTARHTEPLGPPAPGQRGVPGPERRVVPQTNLGTAPVARTRGENDEVFNTDTDEGMQAYRESLGPIVRVVATKMGQIHNVRRRAGDVFDVREGEFSDNWMQRVDGKTPTKATTSKQALKAHHDETLAERVSARSGGTTAAPRSSGDRDVTD